MIRMNPAHDTVNPPGQVREQDNVVNQDKALSYMIDDFKRCSEGYAKECEHEWIKESPYNKQELSFCKKCNKLERLTKEN